MEGQVSSMGTSVSRIQRGGGGGGGREPGPKEVCQRGSEVGDTV